MEGLIRKLLEQLGEDPDRPGLARTPERVALSLKEMTAGYGQDAVELLKAAIFDANEVGREPAGSGCASPCAGSSPEQLAEDSLAGEAIEKKTGDRGMVVTCSDIDFVSLCEHHLLPFFGTVTISYEPGEKLVGISKLVRVVEIYARRLQVQERMGAQILDSICQALEPRGAMVRIDAMHLCMVARGVKKANARMVTVNASGTMKGTAHGGC